MKILGYDSNSDVLEFNNKRCCGLWLLLIGVVLFISILFGGNFLINPIIFMIGYYVCFYIANINKKVRNYFSDGSFSKFQIRMVYISLALLFILMFCISGPFFVGFRWKYIWLGVILATGLHFLLLYFVHGKSMVLLGIMCSLVAVLGYIFSDISFIYFAFSDALLKVLFGIYLLFFSKKSKMV